MTDEQNDGQNDDQNDGQNDAAALRRPKLIYTGGPPHRSLEHAMQIVDQAFDERTYLVGSALKTPDFRDVDCRMIMSDAKFEELFGTGPTSLNALHSLLSVAISEYLSTRSGLPIDFQIQKRSEVTDADWDKMRIPLGVFFSNEEMKPPWMLKPNI